MSTYYKRIDGKNYDKAMLDIAEESVTGKGDGRISLADSRSIVKLIKDGGKITDIEKRTLNYILEKYKFTETALKHIEKSLSGNIDSVSDKESGIEKDKNEMVDLPQSKKADGWNRKILIILIIILLALFAVFAFLKYFYKTDKVENTLSEKKEQISAIQKEKTDFSKTGTAITMPVVKNDKVENEKKLSKNEYIVKDNDTLVKISEEVYGDYKMWKAIYKLNNEKISSPVLLFPGQVLILPEK